jgi:hypothetical protein
MKQTAQARFAIKTWDEKPYSEGPDQPKLSKATVTKTYTGDIDGEGHLERGSRDGASIRAELRAEGYSALTLVTGWISFHFA